MPEKLKERLKTQKYYMTTNLHIVRYLESEGIKPYNIEPSKKHKHINMFFYGNTSMLRACLHNYYETR